MHGWLETERLAPSTALRAAASRSISAQLQPPPPMDGRLETEPWMCASPSRRARGDALLL
jgi:hypothetical protein